MAEDHLDFMMLTEHAAPCETSLVCENSWSCYFL